MYLWIPTPCLNAFWHGRPYIFFLEPAVVNNDFKNVHKNGRKLVKNNSKSTGERGDNNV